MHRSDDRLKKIAVLRIKDKMEFLLKYSTVFSLFIGVIMCVSEITMEKQSSSMDTHLKRMERQRYTPCRLRVKRASAVSFAQSFNGNLPNFAKFIVSFPPEMNYSVYRQVILPNYMFWTYYVKEGVFPYLKWPIDYPILSLGLLNTKTLNFLTWLVFEPLDPPKNCSIILGNYMMNIEIGKALVNLTQDYVLKSPFGELRSKYSYSYWCHLEEKKNVRNSSAYFFALHFGFRINLVQYRCCRTGYARTSLSIRCLAQVKQVDTNIIVSNILTVLLCFVCTLLLFKVSSYLLEMDEKHNTSGHINLNSLGHTAAHQSQAEDSNEWIFLTGRPPINISIMLCSVCGLHKKYPTAISRIRRIFFVFIIPLPIYLQVYIYYMSDYQYEFTMACIDHDLPLGYLAMLGGFWKSTKLFCPYFGGPFCLLLGYHIFGLVLLVYPASTSDILLDGMANSKWDSLSPLLFGIETMEKYSMMTIKSKWGQSQIYRQSIAGIYILFSARFWRHVYMTQEGRIRSLYELVCVSYNKYFLIICGILLLPLYIVICIIEIVVCLFIYGIPLCHCFIPFVKGYFQNFMKPIQQWEGNCCVSCPAKYFMKFLRTILLLIFSVMLIYFLVSLGTIFIASFSFLSQIIVFAFVSLIVNSSVSFGYLFFGCVLLYYIVNIFQKIGAGYLTLLSDAVDISMNLQTEQSLAPNSHPKAEPEMLPPSQTQEIPSPSNRLQNSGRASIMSGGSFSLNSDFYGTGQEIHTTQQFVQYKDQTVGIPAPLFRYLVRQYRPVHIQVAKAVIKLALIVLLMAFTTGIAIVKFFNASEGMSEVMHVVFLVVIGALPRILEIALSNENHALKKEINCRQIRASILEFWKMQGQTSLID